MGFEQRSWRHPHFLQGLVETVESGNLVKEVMSSQFETPLATNLLAKLREDNDLAGQAFGPQGLKDFQAAHPRHMNVQDGEIGVESDNGVERQTAILCFAYQLKLRQSREQPFQQLPNRPGIIHYQNAQRRFVALTLTRTRFQSGLRSAENGPVALPSF
jgi:hypothetical protein